MRQYDNSNLIVHPGNATDPAVIVAVTPEQAGWDYINFQVRRLAAHQSWTFSTGEYEMVIVLLSGRLNVESNRGQWQPIGERKNVFSELPYALYLPRHTSLTVQADSASEFAVVKIAAVAAGSYAGLDMNFLYANQPPPATTASTTTVAITGTSGSPSASRMSSINRRECSRTCPRRKAVGSDRPWPGRSTANSRN